VGLYKLNSAAPGFNPCTLNVIDLLWCFSWFQNLLLFNLYRYKAVGGDGGGAAGHAVAPGGLHAHQAPRAARGGGQLCKSNQVFSSPELELRVTAPAELVACYR
jgi:hypothetical protein